MKFAKKSLHKTFVIILFIVLVIAVLFYSGISWYIASQVTAQTAKNIDISAKVISHDYEAVAFSARDGLHLKGWLFHAPSQYVIILISGVLDNRTNKGYYGDWITKDLIEQKYNVLVYDPRSRGESEGTVRGKDEQNDVIGAVNFLEQKGFAAKNIGIIAYSSGATATLVALEKIQNIGPIVIDSAPARFQTALDHILTAEQHIPSFFLPGIHFVLTNVYGVNVANINPIDHVKMVPQREFLFIHGGKDTSIPPENSYEMAQVNPKSKVIIFPEGDHVKTYRSDPDLYRKEVFGFIENQFAK